MLAAWARQEVGDDGALVESHEPVGESAAPDTAGLPQNIVMVWHVAVGDADGERLDDSAEAAFTSRRSSTNRIQRVIDVGSTLALDRVESTTRSRRLHFMAGLFEEGTRSEYSIVALARINTLILHYA